MNRKNEDMLREYYSNIKNINKIIFQLRNKETIFMNKKGVIIRCINSKFKRGFLLNKDHYRLEQNKYSIYESIANYKSIPLFSWNKKLRQKQYFNWTKNKLYFTYVKNYDYYLDFDNHDGKQFELCKNECYQVSQHFTKRNIQHSIKFSGSGFHIKANTKPSNPIDAKEMTELLKRKYMLSTVDLSIYNWQGMIKTMYTVDTKTMNVCVPVSPFKLKDFDVKRTHISNFI